MGSVPVLMTAPKFSERSAFVPSVLQFRGLMDRVFTPAGRMMVSVRDPSSQSKLTTVPRSFSPWAGTIWG